LESWFTEPKIPLGRWVKIGITWLQDNAAGFFDAVTALIDFLVDGFTAILGLGSTLCYGPCST
jgi:glycine betaine/proline transport system permease protein